MTLSERTALKALTGAFTILNTHYKLYRKVLNVFHPNIRPLYHQIDEKMMVDGREIPLRVFYPKKDPLSKILLFFHGGGWIAGNIDSYTRFCSHMAEQTRHIVIAVNYRLAPEHPFPAGLEDCYFVTREILAMSSLLGCDRSGITLIGDSAGGNLAAAVSLMARDKDEPLPFRQILLYPATYFDHGECSPFPSVHENGSGYILTAERIQNYMDLYVRNEEDKCSPYVAPLLAKDLSRQPKTLIVTAEYDPLRDEGEAYGRKLGQFNNDVTVYRMKNSLHGFLNLRLKSKPVSKCYELINDFLEDKDIGTEEK
jgi:acetyl esterase